MALSTWTVFFTAVLEDGAAAEAGRELSVYIAAIPYMFYAWAAVAIVPLVLAKGINSGYVGGLDDGERFTREILYRTRKTSSSRCNRDYNHRHESRTQTARID